MKAFMLLVVLLTRTGMLVQAQTISKNQVDEFLYHFHILDSLAVKSQTEVILNCPESIRFMEKSTGIESPIGGNWAGKYNCRKTDLRKWHQWFDSKYIKK